MRIIKIKNLQQIEDTYCGQTIQAGSYYTLQNDDEIIHFSTDDKVNQHLWSNPAKICINDGNENLDALNGDKWLKGNYIEVGNIAQATPSDLVVTWSELKIFYDSTSTIAFMNYVDLTTHYYIWVTYRDQKIFTPQLLKDTADYTQFESSYKSKCNIPEYPRVRTTTCKAGRKMHCRYVSFKTACSDPDEQFDNTDYLENDFGDVTYTMKDASGNTTQDYTICKETWLDFFPTFTYELAGGGLFVDSTLSGDSYLWECHVVAVPDIAAQYGGSIIFIANPRLEWIKGSYLEIVADNNPSELRYDATYKTNKIRVIIKHPIGSSANFQLSLRLFK